MSTPGAVAPRTTDARWTRRPVLGRLVRALAVAGPFVVSILLAWLLTSVTPAPDTVVPAILRWVAIAAASSLALVALERAGRRLVPIAALLDLTLVFPDRAPSPPSTAPPTAPSTAPSTAPPTTPPSTDPPSPPVAGPPSTVANVPAHGGTPPGRGGTPPGQGRPGGSTPSG